MLKFAYKECHYTTRMKYDPKKTAGDHNRITLISVSIVRRNRERHVQVQSDSLAENFYTMNSANTRTWLTFDTHFVTHIFHMLNLNPNPLYKDLFWHRSKKVDLLVVQYQLED